MSLPIDDLMDLTKIDSHFGIISMVCTILKIIEENEPVTVKEIILQSREMMAQQVAFCEKDNRGGEIVIVCNMTYPEKIFLGNIISPQKEGRGQTEKAISNIIKNGLFLEHISKNFGNNRNRNLKGIQTNCEKIRKNPQRLNEPIVEKIINEIIYKFDRKPRVPTIYGNSLNNKKEIKKIADRFRYTQSFISVLDNIPVIARNLENSLEEKSRNYLNVRNFPLVGIVEFSGYDEKPTMVYLLSSYDYYGLIPEKADYARILRDLGIGISNFTDVVFNQDPQLNKILADCFEIDAETDCHVRTISIVPKWQKGERPRKIFGLHLISLHENIVSADWKDLPIEKLIKSFKEDILSSTKLIKTRITLKPTHSRIRSKIN